jgi:hypothetical protein
MMVLDLIVDDGVASRGHRLGVYNETYDVVGVAYGPHSTFGMMAAMEFAKGWQPDEEKTKERLASGPFKMDSAIQAKAQRAATTQWKLGSCAVCKEPIKGGRVVDLKEVGKMHADCFKCSECSKQLTGTPYKVHAGRLYCSPCHGEKHGEKCTACGKPLTGGTMKCALGSFHVECLICSKCNTAIGKNKFSTAGGVMTCQKCASTPQPKCASTLQPLAGAGRRSEQLASAGAKMLAGPPQPKPAVGKAKAKAKAAGSAVPKVSMAGAQKKALDLGMDYASLA